MQYYLCQTSVPISNISTIKQKTIYIVLFAFWKLHNKHHRWKASQWLEVMFKTTSSKKANQRKVHFITFLTLVSRLQRYPNFLLFHMWLFTAPCSISHMLDTTKTRGVMGYRCVSTSQLCTSTGNTKKLKPLTVQAHPTCSILIL